MKPLCNNQRNNNRDNYYQLKNCIIAYKYYNKIICVHILINYQ